MPAIANGTANTCASLSGPFVSSSNFNSWLAISDFSGNIVAEINPQGNNLGSVSAKVYINSNAVRQSGNGIYFMDRNIEITPATQPTTPVKVRLYFKQSELTALQNQAGSGVTGLNDIVVTKINALCSGTAAGVGTLIVPDSRSTYLTNGYVVELTVSSFSTFYLHAGNTALPVTISYFDAIKSGNNNLIKWSTSTEQNNKGFEVERSADGIRFSSIGFIAAAGNGNSNQAQQYEFSDNHILHGNNYYRLKQIDLNAAVQYSKVVLIKGNTSTNTIINQLYPNPAKNQITVSVNAAAKEKINLLVTDVTGKKIIAQQFAVNQGMNNLNVDITNIQSGVYLIQIVDNSQSNSIPFKFIK